AELQGDCERQNADGTNRCKQSTLPEPVVGVRRVDRLARLGQCLAGGSSRPFEGSQIEGVHARSRLQQRLIQLGHRAGERLDVEALLGELHLMWSNLRATRAQFVQRGAEARGGLVTESVVPGMLRM